MLPFEIKNTQKDEKAQRINSNTKKKIKYSTSDI